MLITHINYVKHFYMLIKCALRHFIMFLNLYYKWNILIKKRIYTVFEKHENKKSPDNYHVT